MKTFAFSHPRAIITTWCTDSAHYDSINGHARGTAGEPLLIHEKIRDWHESPLSIQEEAQLEEQRQTEREREAIKIYRGGAVLTRNEKDMIAFHLQNVIADFQMNYVAYMNKHRYQTKEPQLSKSTIITYPGKLAQHHTKSCRAHEPGLVRNTLSIVRGYCFGAAKIKGKRVCDVSAPNYLSISTGESYRTFTLYNKTFGLIPFYHISQLTARGRKDRRMRKNSITITTQGSWNRVKHIVAMAKLWQGPISFALLIDNESQIEELGHILSGNPELIEYLDLHLVWRFDHDMYDPDAFYPINMLRNMALQPIETGMVFVLDVDNIPNSSHNQYVKWILEAEREIQNISLTKECPGLDAFIPPAVEILAPRLRRMYRDGNSTDTLKKDLLVEAFFDGTALPMHLYFGPAYVPINHFAWVKAKTIDALPYITRFEPYYIARTPVPLFNETFVNRGGNFAQHIYEIHAAGYTLWRLPQAFMVDIPHVKVSKENVVIDVGSSKAGKIVFRDNKTKQAHHNENFTTEIWEAFNRYLPHRYHFYMPTPSVTDHPFRQYRRSQEKVVNTMWHVLGSIETDDINR